MLIAFNRDVRSAKTCLVLGVYGRCVGVLIGLFGLPRGCGEAEVNESASLTDEWSVPIRR